MTLSTVAACLRPMAWLCGRSATPRPHEPVDGDRHWQRTQQTVEQMALVALTSQCESHLTATTEMPTAFFPIRNQEDPMWQQRLVAMSDPEGPHFHAGVAEMAMYA
jgi:hypothetical protein